MVCAGHEDPLLLSADGKATRVTAGRRPALLRRRISLSAGDADAEARRDAGAGHRRRDRGAECRKERYSAATGSWPVRACNADDATAICETIRDRCARLRGRHRGDRRSDGHGDALSGVLADDDLDAAVGAAADIVRGRFPEFALAAADRRHQRPVEALPGEPVQHLLGPAQRERVIILFARQPCRYGR